MPRTSKLPIEITLAFEEMLQGAQTKLIGPVIACTVVNLYLETGTGTFSARQIRDRYLSSVCELVHFLGYNLHLGANFDTDISREDRGVGRHGILKPTGTKQYQLDPLYKANASALRKWIPQQIKLFLDAKLGKIILLASAKERLSIAERHDQFLNFIQERFSAKDGGISFEIVSFAILKVYLERFACRIYRDTRTFSHEGGTDLSTDFGAVYQIKKQRITHKADVDRLYSEIRNNFDTERIQDGRVVLILDDISADCKSYLLKKNSLKYIQSADLIEIASIINDLEDRQKILRIIYEEFCREYSNDICSRHNCDGSNCKVLPISKGRDVIK
jgi:hypothetical protein